jgi:hypothetical protein
MPRNLDRRKATSYTFSPASVAFLEALRKNLERAVADYYNSLPAESAVEQARWGAFATGEFPRET